MSRILTRLAATAGVLALGLGLAGCQTDTGTGAESEYVTDGKLTIGTGEPAYYPYVIDDAPESGEGFEAAVAYAIAEELGFAPEDVVWVRTTFDAAIAPGPKDFDFNLQQFSITPERAASIDFSSPYYAADQAVITIEGSAAAGATSIADLKDLLIGAQTGTTSLVAVEQLIAPTAGAQVFNTNEDAKLALESGQVDAIVVDVPTAFYMTGVELDGGLILGSLPEIEGATDEWGVVLTKGSPLTARVSAAIDALRDSGKLDELVAEWLGADQGVPTLR
jgi:ABC-type amino acid transport/signal transduction systems, periplasmic component/domain